MNSDNRTEKSLGFSGVSGPVETGCRFFSMPRPEVSADSTAGSVLDHLVGKGEFTGLSFMGPQAEFFEPSSNDMAADSVEPSEFCLREIFFIHAPPSLISLCW